jgi:Zn finger protein HypA/HybF involved in hydrogenase expression
MNPLDRGHVRELLRFVAATRERELNCSECLEALSELAERRLTGVPLDEVLERAEHHLILCPECREEFEALERVLRAVP